MAIKYGFFNSVNGDRTYNADDFNYFFQGIVSDGVFRLYKNELEVEPKTGMTVRVLTGKAICKERYVENTAALDLAIRGGDTQARIDAIVIGTDLEERTCGIYVKEGTPATTPTAPNLLDNANSKELALAYITVSANATTISANNITDKRADVTACGWVKLTNTSIALTTYQNTVPTSGNDSVIDIGIQEYDSEHDTIFVYKNGLILQETTDYLIQGTGSNAKLHLSSSTPAGNTFTFVCMHMGIS